MDEEWVSFRARAQALCLAWHVNSEGPAQGCAQGKNTVSTPSLNEWWGVGWGTSWLTAALNPVLDRGTEHHTLLCWRGLNHLVSVRFSKRSARGPPGPSNSDHLPARRWVCQKLHAVSAHFPQHRRHAWLVCPPTSLPIGAREPQNCSAAFWKTKESLLITLMLAVQEVGKQSRARGCQLLQMQPSTQT